MHANKEIQVAFVVSSMDNVSDVTCILFKPILDSFLKKKKNENQQN